MEARQGIPRDDPPTLTTGVIDWPERTAVVSAGRMTDAVPPAGRPGVAEEAARAGRRLRHVGGRIGRSDLAGAAGHLLLGRPFPEAVDDPASAATRAE